LRDDAEETLAGDSDPAVDGSSLRPGDEPGELAALVTSSLSVCILGADRLPIISILAGATALDAGIRSSSGRSSSMMHPSEVALQVPRSTSGGQAARAELSSGDSCVMVTLWVGMDTGDRLLREQWHWEANPSRV
jgi:hypothetical protein